MRAFGVWIVFLCLLLTSCSNYEAKLEPKGDILARGFMPNVEIVEAEEDFSKDPQFDDVTQALEVLNQDLQLAIHTGDRKELRTHTFSNGEEHTYTAYRGIVFDGDVILGTTKELQDSIVEYEDHLSGNSELISTQGAMYKQYCQVRFLFVCNEKWGGGWPGGVVSIDNSSYAKLSNSQKDLINGVLGEMEGKTDISWKFASTGDRVKITTNEMGCFAVPGRSNKQPQQLNLEVSKDTNCFSRRVVMHEFGHVLGLMHEHQRSDRDKYIDIQSSNLTSEGKAQLNKKFSYETSTPYDYISLMHYDNFQGDRFAKDDSRPVFTGIGYSGPFGNSTLSPNDIIAINQRY